MDEELESLTERLHQLEQKAGVREEAESAREGAFIPYGVFDEPARNPDDPSADSDNYWDHEWDTERRRTRDVYFSVVDSDLRQEMIQVRRKKDRRLRDMAFSSFRACERDLASAERQLALGAGWLVCGIAMAVGAIWGGFITRNISSIADEVGFFIGAALGIFYGLEHRKESMADLRSRVDECQEALADSRKVLVDDTRIHLEFFSQHEQLLGQRDEEFEIESAAGNRVEWRRQGRPI